MKKSFLALTLLASIATLNPAYAVTYHEPNAQMEANLNHYGAGVENWEEKRFVQFTMADAHLYHHWAQVENNPNKAMPIKVLNSFDPAKVMLDDVIPGHKISLYDVMRDRASIQNYVIMNKKGEVIAEDYWNGTNKDTLNHIMSSTKSFSSMAAFIAEEEGLLSMNDPIGKYAPELKGSEWANIPLHYYADMTAGVVKLPKSRDGYHWSNYAAGADGSWDSSMPSAMGYNGHVEKDGKLIPRPDASGEINSFSEYLSKVFVKQAKPANPPGFGYEYRDINTEMLGLAVSRASGMTLAEFYEKYLWKKGGFTSDMAMYTSVNKESMASGAANMTTRDFAIGSFLMVNDGKNFKGEQVLPKKYIEQVKNGDDEVKQAWGRISYEHLLMPTAFYKNQWRTVEFGGRKFSTMIGVNGQFSAFDHKTGNIIALTGAYREPSGQAMVLLYVEQVMLNIFNQLDK
ncbi:serine hydrolase [Vibrio tubiashii]|uniref:Serine hydrolase n=1 Tax=Vibrio tubiashii TaxID=29498 RepID=A0AAE5GPZ8_9VIBR|nr:serine hydrolase [Vibrio tubiashii]NOI80566.1 serine hydrolase [Vibrio tubiashii]